MKRALLAMLVAWSGCSSLAPLGRVTSWSTADWGQFGGGPERKGTTALEFKHPPVERKSLSLSGIPAQGSILYSNGLLVVPVSGGSIDLFLRSGGPEKGRIPVDGWITGTPVLLDSLLIYPFVKKDGYVACYDLASRNIRWEKHTGLVETALLLTGERVAAATSDGEVHCWNVRDTSDCWLITLPKGVFTPPASSDSLIYVACDDGAIHALSIRDGSGRWSHPGGAAFATGPVATSHGVLTADRKGVVSMLKSRDGEILWRHAGRAPVLAAPCADDSSAYVAFSDGKLRSLNLADGSLRWERDERTLLNMPLLLTRSGLIYVTARGKLCLLEKSSGQLLWSAEAGGGARTAPAAALNALMVCGAGKDAELFLFDGKAE